MKTLTPKRLALAALVAVAPAAVMAQEAAPGGGMPAVTAGADDFDKWLGVGDDFRDLSRGVEHLHGRVAELDRALGAADARFQAQGGADPVQKALLYNGSQARDGLRTAYERMADYSRKLGLAWRLEQESDARLMAVFAKQADAVSRLQQASAEARRFADGMQRREPRSAGGDPDAGQLSSIEPQESELADINDKVQLAKDGLADLEGKLDGLSELQAKVKSFAEKAGLLDDGAGQALSQSVTGRGGQAAAGSSRAIISDALKTLEKGASLGGKTRGLVAALVERTKGGVDSGREAERGIVQGRDSARAALDTAARADADINGPIHSGWQQADDSGKPPYEDQAQAKKDETSGAAGQAASAAQSAGTQAAAAKAAGSTCPCAKKKAAQALGDTQKLASLQKLGNLELKTAAEDGSAPARASFSRVNTAAMSGLLRGASFDGSPR